MWRGIRACCLLLALAANAQAADLWEEGWIFSPIAGVAVPKLDVIYNKAFFAPLAGQSELRDELPQDAQGESAYSIVSFRIENNLPKPGIAPEAGLEFRKNFGTRNDFIIGVSAWEIGSAGTVLTTLTLQGVADNDAIYERRAKFSYTQYFLGLRHYLRDRKQKNNFYVNATLHEFFDLDYKETHVLEFLSGPPKGFKRVAVYQTQSTGLLLGQLGLGFERMIGSRFSFGLEAAYAKGVNRGVFRTVQARSDFNQGDRLMGPPKPLLEGPDGAAYVLGADGESRHRLDIVLDGWRVTGKMNVAF
ncbi:MAG: hypothetical protein OEW58_04850 [Gammaproteobacteria bacterium]|nr:hypothetical protein [Gammaproteobacteria bacterium]